MADTTDFRSKAEILAELWMDYRDDEGFKDFIEYNDLGLPLAYAVANGIVDSNEMVERFIDETFRVLLAATGVEDLGYETLQDLLEQAPEAPQE
jgi:hypothetical protein